jgi:carboxymethylenebutenolidase
MADAFMSVMQGGGVPDDRCLGDVEGAAAHARSFDATAAKVGVIGYCSGGRQAYLAGVHLPFDAIVDAYGGGLGEAWPRGVPLGAPVPSDVAEKDRRTSPLDLSDNMSGPLLGLFGEIDPFISVEEVRHMETELRRNDKSCEVTVYPGATHAFFSVGRSAHLDHTTADVKASLAGWKAIWAFLGQHLG